MFAALYSFSRRAPRACNATLDALYSPIRAAVPSASAQACAARAGAASHQQWPAYSAPEAALWTRLCSTHVNAEGACAAASRPSTAGPRLTDSDAAWQTDCQLSNAVHEQLRTSVWQPAVGSGPVYEGRRPALRHCGNEQWRRMATARGPSAVPLQTARVEHAPIALDGHGDAPAARPAAAARAAPAGRHAEHPFPVKAFYIGVPQYSHAL